MEKVLMAILFAAFSSFSMAQSTVGDLLAQGGKAATKEEAVNLMVRDGVKIKYESRRAFIDMEIKADGTISGGQIKAPQLDRDSYPVSGTWSMTDTGKFCYSIGFQAHVSGYRSSISTCTYEYILDGKLRHADSDSPDAIFVGG